MERARANNLESILHQRVFGVAVPARTAPVGDEQPVNRRMSFDEAKRRVAEYEKKRIAESKDIESNIEKQTGEAARAV